ncbi:MAG TPA: hypothetical protein VKD91_09710, partial [Pyrinomonadaceae bacterium]|nr:hypothetical protein [Pyrinomonadaceae bacterium]
MNELMVVALVLLGALVGSVAVWLALRAKTTRAFESGQADSLTQIATLNERLAAKDREAQKLQEAFEREGAERARANDEASTLKAQLAAEQRGARARDESFKQATTELAEKFKALSR